MISVVGIGALGSHVALLLRNEKPGLKLIDFDQVDAHNTSAQFHSVMSLRKNKALALQQALQGLFNVKASAIPHKLTEDNAETLLKGSDLVIDCTDNIAARKVLISACKKLQLPLLHGALAASGDFARIVWMEAFTPDSESGDTQATCIDGAHLPFHGAAASYLALEAQRFLKTGKKCSWQLTPSGVLRLA